MSVVAFPSSGRPAALSFVEREPYERGFAQVFDREIAPGLAALEKERLALRRTLLMRSLLPAAAVIGTIALFIWSLSAEGAWWVTYLPVVGLVGAILLGMYAYAPASRFADKSRDLIMGPVCAFLGKLTYMRSGTFNLQRFVSCGMLGSYNKARIEDIFVGQHRDVPFEMAEALLERSQGAGKNRTTVTVFRGLLIALDLPEKVEGRILVSRDLGRIGNKISGWFTGWKGLTRVELPNREFESRFEVYADSPEEARRVLSADFLDTMVAIAKAHTKSAVRAGFVEGQFLLALPMSRNLFEPRSIFRSVYGCTDNIRDVLGQITIAHRVIDFLKGDRPARVA